MAKRLIHSVFYLTLLQGGQYLASLMILPLLSRRLGLEGYGQLGYCMAIIAYFVLVTDWGFQSSASKEIAVHRNDRTARSELFWNVIGARLLLLVLSICLLAFLNYVFKDQFVIVSLVWVGFISVLATALSPAFYLLGIERIEVSSLAILVCRLGSIPLIYFFVDVPSDVWLAVLLQSGFLLVAGLASWAILWRSKEIIWVDISWCAVLHRLRLGASTFVSGAIPGFVASSFTLALGFVSDPLAVGAYVAAMNILKAFQGMLAPLMQPLFPRLSKLFAEQRSEGWRLLRRVLLWLLPIALLVTFGMAFAANWLPMFLGHQFDVSVHVLQILSLQFLFYAINNLMGSQLMIILGHPKAFARLLFASGLLGVVAAMPLGYVFGANGVAAATVVTELLVTVFLYTFYINKNRTRFCE